MKIFKYVLMFILIASTMALAGCGGDKFAGKWYALDEDYRLIYMLDITKNGENYLIKRNHVRYTPEFKQVATETVEKEESMWSVFNGQTIKRKYQIPVYDVTLNLEVENISQDTEIENKGQLGRYTYIEKDGTLQGPGLWSNNKFTYKKGGEKDLIKKLQTAVTTFYDKIKSGEEKIRIEGKGGDNKIKDYKFNEELPQELK